MKARIARAIRPLLGMERPRVIAVFGARREEVKRSVEHVQAGGADLPVWAWCEEESEPVEGCARFASGRAAWAVRKDLSGIWPALAVVAWTASGGSAKFKLLPFFAPPFRVLVQNEAGDFFPARPGPVMAHGGRRMRDGFVSAKRRVRDWICAMPLLCRQARVRSTEILFDTAGIVRSLGIRSGEWMRDRWNMVPGMARSARFRTIDWVNATGHLAYEFELRLLAFAAKGTPEWARDVVQRHRGRRHLAIELEARGNSPVEVRLRDRGWPRGEVLRALRTDADYIIFRRTGETGDAGGLIELARARNAFAAAKQVAHSHWRPRVLTKHPFRRLQEGEVSQVFAPWSTLLVVQREALAKMGCPRALTSGAALMIVFWKAAAAGLASLVANCGGEVTDENAMVLEDAEFAARLAFDPRLNGLGPLYPSRLRGTVASVPAMARGATGKPRVLVVSPYLPWPLSHGGAVRIYNLCRALAGEVDFILACFHENGEKIDYERLHEVFREVYIVDADERKADAEAPAQVAEYRSSAMAELIRDFCLGHRVDLVQLEYTQMAEYRNHTGAVPVLLVEHDITFTLHRQLAETRGDAKSREEYERWLRFEREALQCSNAVWTMSEQDRDLAVQFGAAPAGVAVVPNGVDLRRFRPEPKTGAARTILFVGSFRHLPNLLAFEALREEIMPEVWREFPEARLHAIAGPNHERAAETANKAHLLESDPRIRVEGFVEDVRPAYRGADVVAIPLPVSAGTNIKLMEAMACGRAIVSTPVGCQGLNLADGHDLLVASPGDGFAAALKLLLRDEALRNRMAADARITAERRFGWDAIAESASASYARLLGRGTSVAAD